MPVVTNARSIDTNQFMDPFILDILLAQPEFINELSSEETVEAITVVDGIIEQRDPEIYGGSTYKFYEAASEQTGSYNNEITVYTPGGRPVRAKIIDSEWTQAEKDSLYNYWHAAYPSARKVADATKKYNCYSFAWYSASTANTVWVIDPNPYLQECTRVSSLSTGTRVMYFGDSGNKHAAIQLAGSSGATVTSKWGNGPLFNHAYTYCPYYSSALNMAYYRY